jgi:hypothetical protein
MSEILYNFSANNASLEDVHTLIGGIHEARLDIDSIFRNLMSAYEGEGASALNNAHIQLNNMLDDALTDISTTTSRAQEQQAAMQALDRANAAAF